MSSKQSGRGRYRVQTTDSVTTITQLLPISWHPPKTTGPNQIWVADITYILTDEGWLYLAGALDLHSRKIVGWAMSQTIDSALVLAALAMASLHRTCHLGCFSIPTGVFTPPAWSHP